MSWQKYDRTTTVSPHEKQMWGNVVAYIKVRAFLEDLAAENIEVDGRTIKVQGAAENPDGSTRIRITVKGRAKPLAVWGI